MSEEINLAYAWNLICYQPQNIGCLMEFLQQNDDTLRNNDLTFGNSVPTVEVVWYWDW